MSATGTTYTTQLSTELGYLATWLPTAHIECGEVGYLDGREFIKTGRLEDYSIPYEVVDGLTTGSIRYTSSGGVSVRFKAAGQPTPTGSSLPQAEAGFNIEFMHQCGVVFELAGCRHRQISNVRQLNTAILELFRIEAWPKNQLFVTEVVTADRASVLISSQKGAAVELCCRGELNAAGATLADASTELEVRLATGLHTQILGERGLSPLFRARHVRKRLWGQPDVRSLGFMTPSRAYAEGEVEFIVDEYTY